MDSDHNQTKFILATRASLLELAVVAVVIALGVNLVASGVTLQIGWSGLQIIGLGASLVLLGYCLLAARIVPQINRHFYFGGSLPVITKTNKVIPIDRYKFVEDTARHIAALSAENKALAKAWAENSLSGFQHKDGLAIPQTSAASKLACEAVEYFVINQLSLHLSSYFGNNPQIDDGEIRIFRRSDIPSVLLENRFLELFSKSMEEREAFQSSGRQKSLPKSGGGDGMQVR